MNIYTKTARFDTARALTEDELHRLAPSVFAVAPHESRSERFQPIPTIEIVRALAKEGFHVVGARQSGTRDESRKDFTKHLLRLRRLDNATAHAVGDTVCEMLLKNANDGTAAYDLMAGLFRIRCLNSMVSQTAKLDDIKVRHTGSAADITHKVIEGTYTVLDAAQKALAAPQDWGTVSLNADEQAILAEAAHVLRFGDADGNVETPIKPAQLLIPRRFDDRAADLWTQFNVVQENVIKGGLSAVGRDANGRRRRSTTRAVNGIDQDVKLNKALWLIGERMAELKGIRAAA